MSGELPDIFGYTDHRAYLGDWFEAKKRANRRYSHRMFARRAGQKSPSLLKSIIDGSRNLTDDTTEAFLLALDLSADEARFFRDLVALDAAKTDEARNEAWSRMSAQRRFREARRVEGASFAYLSDWYVPAIRELATTTAFRADPAWIAATLVPAITKTQAKHALGVLRDLGMIVDRDDGGVDVVDGSIVTAPEVTGLAVHNYHRGMAERAREAVTTFQPDERHLLGVTVRVPDALVPVLKDELNAMQARLLDLCDATEAGADRVYQLNLQLFPLSRPTETP